MATHDSNIKAVVRFSNIKKFSAEKFAHFLNAHGQSVFKVEQTRVLYCGEGRVYAILELANRNSGYSFADVCKHALSLEGQSFSHKNIKVSMTTLEEMKRSYERYKSKQQHLKDEKLLEKLNGSVNSGGDSSILMPSAVHNGSHNGSNNGNNAIWSQPNPDKAYSTTSSNLLSNQSADTETRPEHDYIILFKGRGGPSLPLDLTVDEILSTFSGISQHSISAFDREPPSGILMIKRLESNVDNLEYFIRFDTIPNKRKSVCRAKDKASMRGVNLTFRKITDIQQWHSGEMVIVYDFFEEREIQKSKILANKEERERILKLEKEKVERRKSEEQLLENRKLQEQKQLLAEEAEQATLSALKARGPVTGTKESREITGKILVKSEIKIEQKLVRENLKLPVVNFSTANAIINNKSDSSAANSPLVMNPKYTFEKPETPETPEIFTTPDTQQPKSFLINESSDSERIPVSTKIEQAAKLLPAKPKPRIRQYYLAFKIPDEITTPDIMKNCFTPGQTIYTQPSTVTPCINPKTKQVKAMLTITGLKNSFVGSQSDSSSSPSPKKAKSTIPSITNIETKISTIRLALRGFHLIIITESIRLLDEDTIMVCAKHKESFNLKLFSSLLTGVMKDTLKLSGNGLIQPLKCNVVQI